MQETIYNLITQKDEVTWQSIIHDLVKSEELDPWNIDVSLLTKRYLATLQSLKEHNFFISGKVLLASAILLKIKSVKLVEEYLADFDNQLFQRDEDLLLGDDFQEPVQRPEVPGLLIKTPQPRKKKLTLNDLMQALEKALEVEERRKFRMIDEVIAEAVIPEKKIDITALIKSVYTRIRELFKGRDTITFTELVNSDRKEDKIMTFIPLLHLDVQNKIDIQQEIPFGEISIALTGK